MSTTDEIPPGPGDSTALTLSRQLSAGELDPIALLEAALTRVEDRALEHVFISLTTERARREAEQSRARHREGRALGPLDGVPIAWKDVFDVAGAITTAGSAIRRCRPPAAADAAVVRDLAAAGTVCVGKTNLSEFAFSGLGLNPHFGTPRNPHGGEAIRIPGGSSSGSAVAVAAGVVPCAIGSDTAGSVRAPAALCGVVGYKATAGRVDGTGVFPLAPSLDSIGVFARSVADITAVGAALGRVPFSPSAPATDTTGLHLVVPDGEWVDAADDEVRDRFHAVIALLRRSGMTIERRRLKAVEEAQALLDTHGSPVAAEASLTHPDLLGSPEADRLDPYVAGRLTAGRTYLTGGYPELMGVRGRLVALLRAELAGAFLVCPTVRLTAPLMAPLLHDTESYSSQEAAVLRNTAVTSFLDMPGVSLPVGADAKGMPIGLLLSARSGHDAALLRLAGTVEAVLA